ncbi:MAG TPA: CDP-glycerol glycerophosphotransferase family protein [Clostridiales bacterium]|nr:MAG: putative CDP-glycerol:glycerophosphate glycerophosphotransferase [Firmicutes bacterium ADurb.Bin262]HOU09902.1 CDP-glycerol glycerophosphotransferase family protein [Clostridiales bacterium]HQK73007.1 CDP-glycerol glycerophosphotransferase family protein [Clostridiales bacterium]
MKEFFYRLYALCFRLARLFPVRADRVSLISPHNAAFTDSLGEIKTLLEQSGAYRINLISRRDLAFVNENTFTGMLRSVFSSLGFFTLKAYRLATSKYVFLNDNFMPMARLNFSRQAVVTQLWHAEGAFKRFGMALDLPQETAARLRQCNERLTCAVCSSPGVVDVYAEAFGLPRERVLPLGSPRTDFFFREHDLKSLREKLDDAYPACRGKALILYAPTFRDDPGQDKRLPGSFDFATFKARYGGRYELLARLHPQVHASGGFPAGVTDVTSWPHVGELVLLCDLLITDYSSICMDFALLRKPCVFYAYDLEAYTARRNFYYEYKDYVPGAVAETFAQLLDALEDPSGYAEKLERFRAFNFGNPDGRAARRVLDTVMAQGAFQPPR